MPSLNEHPPGQALASSSSAAAAAVAGLRGPSRPPSPPPLAHLARLLRVPLAADEHLVVALHAAHDLQTGRAATAAVGMWLPACDLGPAAGCSAVHSTLPALITTPPPHLLRSKMPHVEPVTPAQPASPKRPTMAPPRKHRANAPWWSSSPTQTACPPHRRSSQSASPRRRPPGMRSLLVTVGGG